MTNHQFLDPYPTGRPLPAARRTADRLLRGPHLSILSTSNLDGSPQTSVIFVIPDGEGVLFSTIEGRRKTANMHRDPRVSLLVHSLPGAAEQPTYVVFAGPVELSDDPEGAFHQVMYDRHMGGAPAPLESGAHRLIVRLTPRRIYTPPLYVAASD